NRHRRRDEELRELVRGVEQRPAVAVRAQPGLEPLREVWRHVLEEAPAALLGVRAARRQDRRGSAERVLADLRRAEEAVGLLELRDGVQVLETRLHTLGVIVDGAR